MKKLLILGTLIFMSSCGKTVDRGDEEKYLKTENGVQYYKGSPYSGKLVEFYDDDKNKLFFEVNFEEAMMKCIQSIKYTR